MTASASLETMFFPSEPAKVYLPSCGSPCKIKFSCVYTKSVKLNLQSLVFQGLAVYCSGRLTCAWFVPRFRDTSVCWLAPSGLGGRCCYYDRGSYCRRCRLDK
ncbi:hypothetical protein P692DRAFT_20160168 [Suillus brevipes Sb2]|nr:hypothetical protein P692DRAFT_20160168 [Suillus brevipes Sb2]